mgnify:CR=1 FL=1
MNFSCMDIIVSRNITNFVHCGCGDNGFAVSFTISYVNIKRPTHKVGQVYTKIDIKPSGLTKERLAFMKTQMRLLYDDK